jgi:hypothetical protein
LRQKAQKKEDRDKLVKEKSAIQTEDESHNKQTEKLDAKTQKAKRPKEEKPSAVEFPAHSHLNPYGFIFMRKHWLHDLGWTKGMKLQIEKNPDNSITVRKA